MNWKKIAKEFWFNDKEMSFEGPTQRMAEEIARLRKENSRQKQDLYHYEAWESETAKKLAMSKEALKKL
jgi:beta-phosphoglucomutase-like phosphatase (HAD superfamily)